MQRKYLKAHPVIDAMRANNPIIQTIIFTKIDWETASSLCILLATFAEVTKNQSGKFYASLSISTNLYKILLGVVNDFITENTGIMSDFGISIRNTPVAYTETVYFEQSKLAKALDLRFSNKFSETDLCCEMHCRLETILVVM